MKRIISFILAMLMILGAIAGLVSNIAYAEKEDNTPRYIPNLRIENEKIPKGNAGNTVTVSFKLRNDGSGARNIKISTDLGTDSPLTVADLTAAQTIDQLNYNTAKDVNMKFLIAETAREGTYPVKINFRYQNLNETEEFQFEQTIFIKVTNFNTQPRLIIEEAKTDPENLVPGSQANLSINLANKGSIAATDLSVELDGLNSAEGFFVNKGSNKAYIKRVNGNDDTHARYNIQASKNIKPGGHELTVNIKYKAGNEVIEDTQKIFLNVGAKGGGNSNLNIQNINFPTHSIRPGNEFIVRFNLKNSGKMNANNVIIKAESTDESVVPKSQSVKKIDVIEAGKATDMSFVFTPTNDATTRNYPISITVEYEDELNQNTENKYVVSQYVGIYVDNPKKEDKPDGEKDGPKSKPKLIIDKYSFNPTLVKAGENFTMNLSFFNTNATKAVKNIKIFLTADEKTEGEGGTPGGGNVFTPVETSNTFYIDSIPPKGKVEKSIKMFTVPNASPKTYTITANFEYEDGTNTEYTATELIGVPVVQKTKLEVGQINLGNEFYANEANPVSVEFYNTGKSTLYNLMVRLEGNFTKENGSLYVGNFETGNNETFDASIIPDSEGNLEGEIVFTYEDSSGEAIEHREPFSVNVVAGMMDEFPDDFEEFPDEPTGIKKLLKSKLFWLALAAVAGVIIFKVRKKKKEDKEFDNEDDYYDDFDDTNSNQLSDTIDLNNLDDKGQDSDEI